MQEVWILILVVAVVWNSATTSGYAADDDDVRYEIPEFSSTTLPGTEETQDTDVLACDQPPSFGHAKANKQVSGLVLGTDVTYRCDFGYFTDGPQPTSRCVQPEEGKPPVWTAPRITCTPQSCGDPGFVPNSRRVGFLFTFPNSVEYLCEPGYILSGPPSRFCLTSGQWSGRLPSCTKIRCSPPQNPEHGQAIFSSLEFGSELKYKCNDGYAAKNQEIRICSEGATWSGNVTRCIEAKCDLPETPKHGSMEILGGRLRIGSIIVYSCNNGRILSGSKQSKCLEIGEWTSDPPQCLDSCTIPIVDNGRIGKYHKPTSRYQSNWIFKKIPVGTKLKDGEKLFLICASGYDPLGGSDWQRVVRCTTGLWSQTPVCKPASCRVTPPGAENATVTSVDRVHGGSVLYECRENFELVQPANVVCHLGVWKGSPPLCVDTRCFLDRLHYPGLVRDSSHFYRSGESYEPRCSKGFQLAQEENNTISCINGRWIVREPPCVAAPCFGAPPAPPNGHLSSLKKYYPHNSVPVYGCDDFYYVTQASTVQCLAGEWVGQPPVCADSRCYVKDLKQVAGVDVTRSLFAYHEQHLVIHCMEDYSVTGSVPLCLYGKWQETNSSPCFENSCPVFEIAHGTMTEKIETQSRAKEVYTKIALGTMVRPHYYVHLTCDRGYTFQGQSTNNVRLTCRLGKWNPHPTCLTRGSKLPMIGSRQSNGVSVAKAEKVHHQVSTASTFEVQQTSESYLKPENNWNEGNCSCEYPVNDPQLLAHAGERLLEFKSLVKKSVTVYFRCKEFGFARLMGPQSITCNCGKWHSAAMPSCAEPRQGDATIFFDNNVKITANGTLQIERRSTVRLICYAFRINDYPEWNFPPRNKVRAFKQEQTLKGSVYFSAVLDIVDASLENEGTYSCSVPSFRSNTIQIRVVDSSAVCPELAEDNMVIRYSRGQEVNSSATFLCKEKKQKMIGIDVLTCTASGQWSHPLPHCTDASCPELPETENLRITFSAGNAVGSVAQFHCMNPSLRRGVSNAICLPDETWSDPNPSCELPACSVDSLSKMLPEGTAPQLEEGTSEVPYQSTIGIVCAENLVPMGQAEATCGDKQAWEIGEFQCLPGCTVPQSAIESKLILEPEQSSYKIGEQASLSCPTGMALTSDVEVMMCLNNGWSQREIPECQYID